MQIQRELSPARRRVVITGMGAVSPFGHGAALLWEHLDRGDVALGAFDVFDAALHRTHIAGQVREKPGRDPLAHLRPRARRRLSRSDRFALCAAFEAVADAKLDVRAQRSRTALFFGSSTGGMFESERFYWRLRQRDQRRLAASEIASQQNNGPGDAVARHLGLQGPVETVAAACAAATIAIGTAWSSLRDGEADIALTGGSDSLCQLTYAGFNSLRAVSEEPCRPFRADRQGLSLGEGAGVLVLETLEHARARGADALIELCGAGFSCDAHHMTAPEPRGAGAAQAIQSALDSAGIGADEIDFVNAHGTGTAHNDLAESQALFKVFGERARKLPVTSTKAAIGHLLGACGAIEAIVTAQCLTERAVHRTSGNGPLDPACPIQLVVDRTLALPLARTALSLNLAFGGANAALILRRIETA